MRDDLRLSQANLTTIGVMARDEVVQLHMPQGEISQSAAELSSHQQLSHAPASH